MTRSLGLSIIFHSLVFVAFGLWLCPWLETRYTYDRRALINVDLFEVGSKTQIAGSKSPSQKVIKSAAAKSKAESDSLISQAVAAPTPVSAVLSEAPLNPKTELVQLESGGDGVDATTLSVLDYFRYAVGKNEAPAYPRLARIKQEQGSVLIRVVVRREGSLAEVVELSRSSGSELLDRVALEAVQRWKFPAFKSARNRIEGVIPFSFTLE